jgi:mannosyltransferase
MALRVRTRGVGLAVATLTIGAALLRLPTLGRQSLWLDEAQTAYEVRRSFAGMFSVLASNELTPPLYYVLLWPWARIAGTSEVALRLPSAAAGVASVPLAYFAGRAVRSTRVGVIAAAFVATSAAMVWYSQEARSYAVFVCLSIATIVLFVDARRHPDAKHVYRWGAVAALALLTHYFAGFLIAVEAVWLFVVARNRWLLRALGALVVLELALTPLLIHQADAFPPPASGGFGIRSHFDDLVRGFATVGYPARHLVLASGVLAVLAALFVMLGDDADRSAAFLATSFAAGALLLPVVGELAGAAIYNYVHLLGAWFPLALTLAVALGVRRFLPVGALVAVAICAGSVVFVGRTAARPALQRDDWRGAFEALGQSRERRAIVTSWVFERFPVAYYDPRAQPATRGTVRVRELDLVGVGEPPKPRIPTGFARVSIRRIQRMTIVRYRASRPRRVSRARLRPPGARSRAVGLFVERPDS